MFSLPLSANRPSCDDIQTPSDHRVLFWSSFFQIKIFLPFSRLLISRINSARFFRIVKISPQILFSPVILASNWSQNSETIPWSEFPVRLQDGSLLPAAYILHRRSVCVRLCSRTLRYREDRGFCDRHCSYERSDLVYQDLSSCQDVRD